MRTRRRSGTRSDGLLRPYRAAAIVLLVFGVLCVLVELQSSSLVLWTGERVRGTDDGGIAYYVVDGEQRTLDVPGEPPPVPEPVTVYAWPGDPSHDRVWQPVRWFDAGFVLLPFALAGTVLGVGLVARRRFYRRVAAAERGRRDRATAEWLRSGRGAGPRPSRSNPSR